MKNLLLGIILLVFVNSVSAQQTVTQEISDDGFVEVPLQFVFPYYGQLFTTSWMFDNGVVGFYSPFNGYNGGQNYFSQPFSAEMGGQFSYMIAPLWTDLINYSGTFTTQGNPQYQIYNWNNISQWGYPENLNTFSLEIRPSGEITVTYDQVNISGYPVSTGMTGNVTQGEFQQMFYAPSDSLTTTADVSWNSYNDPNVCEDDPLSSTECPGYYDAYFAQQCSLDPLYDSQCPGYEIAYFAQQCSLDPLYDSQCPGYEIAYFDQQCSIDPLYNNQCPGYATAFVLSTASDVVINEPTVQITVTAIATIVEVSDTVEEQQDETVAESEIIVTLSTTSVATTEATETEVSESAETTKETTLSPSLLRLALSLSSDAGPVSSTTTALTQSVTAENKLEDQAVSEADNNTDVAATSSDTTSDYAATDNSQTQESAADILSLQNSESLAQAQYANNTESTNNSSNTDDIVQADSEMTFAEQDALDIINATVMNQVITESMTTAASNNTSSAFSNNNMQQILAMGGTITQILNTPVPDFSRFEIKPPTQEEQTQTAKVENTLESMSAEEIESQAELRIGSMDPAAQAIAVQLIGHRSGFDQYGGVLTDQSNWYLDRSVYTNNRVPTASSSNLIFGAQDQRHQELMSLQYRR
jgi:hypothetical protein